mgnify:CR=1 FL=1
MSVNQNFHFIVKTQAGLEQLLAEELTALGATKVQVLQRAVKCVGDSRLMYRINYASRLALRVLKEVMTFEAPDERALYQEVKQFNWPSVLDSGQTLAVHATVNNSRMTHSHFVALKTKDAIVDSFRDKTGRRPDVDVQNPDMLVQIHINGMRGTLLLDSSGDSLHKRGYRTKQGTAPINEVLAAGMIRLTGWDGNSPLLDPMCGSSTIPCEAVMIALNMPAGYFRKDFGFMHWNDFDPDLWKKLKEEENAKISKQPVEIFGYDVNQNALALADEIVRNAGFEKYITLKQVAFENSKPPMEMPGYIITNPPYGERIKKEDILAFYRMIGDTLKSRYAGYSAWLITAHMDALKSVGLRTSKKIKLYNGPLECRFVKYEMYRGSRKKGQEKE